MTAARPGKIVTFYSYKGGTGRTMALANVAWILAAAGKRVLVADWDLEAPGLYRFFTPFLKVGPIAHLSGVIDLVREYEDQVLREPDRVDTWVKQLAKVDRHAFSLHWEFPNDGVLDMLTAGRQNQSYAATLGALNWDTFYENLGGAAFLDALRDDMRENYDYTLIDSRTGFSDVADICTQHLPDIMVDCYVLSNQGIDGAARVAQAVATFSKRGGPGRGIRILPVAMRVDGGEKEKADAGRKFALRMFPDLPGGMTESERSQYFDSVEVPYQTYYAYEEKLATFGDKPGSHTTLLAAYERLTGFITAGEVTSLPAMDESVREQWKLRYERSAGTDKPPIRLRYAGADQVWADWVSKVLASVDVAVIDEGMVETEREVAALGVVLTIVSPGYRASRRNIGGPDPWLQEPHLLLLVDDVRMPERMSASQTSIVDAGPGVAVERLLRLVGQESGAEAPGVRFPRSEPRWFNPPARNPRFTGRVEDLHRLRRQLDEGSSGLPVVLHGLGGVGKTQLALEYAHRFRSDYDAVWWIAGFPAEFIDAALIDLGVQIGLPIEGLPAQEASRRTLEALRLGSAARRWLLVYDNVEEPEHLRSLLPGPGPGHVLITSRNRDWAERANEIAVEVFRRDESVAHLRDRATTLTDEHAEQVAEALGDLPIAISAAGAWLADTGVPAPDYVRSIREGGAGRQAVQATWDLSLDRLRTQSPGGYRLLQICSVLASDIALDLLYSDTLMAPVAQVDPAAAERDMRGALVQSINRLALLKLDVPARQVQVHQLLQEVVRARMNEEGRAGARHDVHLALAAFRPGGEPDDPETWERFRMIWRHLRVSGAEACNEEDVRALLIDRVRYLWRRGEYGAARRLGERVAESWATLLTRIESPGDEPPVTDVAADPLRHQLLRLRFNIANVRRDQSDFVAALELDEQVLAAQRAELGDRHAHTLQTMGSYAADLRALGRYAEALPMEEATNKAWVERFGEDHPRTLSSANNLAASLRAVGAFSRAMRIDEEVIGRRRSLLGPTHPYTLHSQTCLGRDLREAGDYAESERLLRTVFDACREHLGVSAPETLDAQVSFATSLRSVGNPAEAAPLLEDAYRRLTDRFGERSPRTLACRLTRAGNLLAMHEDSAALDEMRTVTAIYHEEVGPNHPFSLVCTNNQSAALRRRGDLKRAAELATTAAAGCRRSLGESHPHYLAAAMNEAACRHESGDVDGAAIAMNDITRLMLQALGSTHPDYLAGRANLAIIESARSGSVTSNGIDAAVDALEKRLGADHQAVTELRSGNLLYRVTDPQDPF